jgi:hypothetical protein
MEESGPRLQPLRLPCRPAIPGLLFVDAPRPRRAATPVKDGATPFRRFVFRKVGRLLIDGREFRNRLGRGHG